MFKKLLSKLQENQMRRTAYWQLQNLTNKELNDIGLCRGDIRRIAYKDPIKQDRRQTALSHLLRDNYPYQGDLELVYILNPSTDNSLYQLNAISSILMFILTIN